MKKIRNLAVAVFCGALVILGMQSQAAAQQVEHPGNLGENKGTGETMRRVGSWELTKIETTIAGFSLPRRAKGLPVDTREKKGISWGYRTRRITADFVFKDLKETVVTHYSAGGTDASLKVFVKAAVTGEGKNRDNPAHDFVAMKCTLDFTLASGQTRKPTKDYSYTPQYRIYTGSDRPEGESRDWFSKKGEFPCGGDGIWLKEEEDFTLNFRLLVEEGGFDADYAGDVTYHFFYKWKGWDKAADTPASSGSTSFPGDAGVGPLDRDGQYRWAQKQDASTLESRLSSNAGRLFNSPSVSSEKLSSAFADVSVIADRSAKANYPADDKDAASSNWPTHKNWAARQGPKAALENLRQKLSAAFGYLSRSQKDLFFADVSVAMAKAEVAEPANQAAAQDGPFVKPTKSVFAVGEDIVVEYGYAKSSGWDWVVVAQPGRELEATGSHSGINPKSSYKLDPNDNSLKDRRGTINFTGLPEGKYVAKYISWPNGHAVLTSTEITVGKASSPPTSGGQPPAGSTSGDLSGLWRNPGGNAVYRFRQIGKKLHWGVDAVPLGSFANVFEGDISGAKIEGSWIDLPGSPLIGGGKLFLKIESECKIVKMNEVNHYGAEAWVRKDSMCDGVSLTQRSNPTGTKPASKATKPATTDKQTGPIVASNDPGSVFEKPANAKPKSGSPAKSKPKIEESPADRGRTSTASAPTTNKTNKPAPAVEEIPEDNSTKVAATKPARKPGNKPPVVEEIPESASPNVASNRPRANSPKVEEIPETSTNNPPATNRSGGNTTNSSGSSGTNQPKTKPKKEKKPRDPNKPDIWTRVGRAVRQGIEQQPTQPTDTQQPTQPTQQPDGQCRGGSYWLGTPTPSSWVFGTPGAGVRIPWSTPFGVTGAKIFIFYAGTNNRFTDSALPENANACGLSYSFYPNAAGYFDAYLYQGTTPVAGPVRFVVTQ